MSDRRPTLVDSPKWVQCPNCGTWSIAHRGRDTRTVLMTGQPVCAGECATAQAATHFGPDDIRRFLERSNDVGP